MYFSQFPSIFYAIKDDIVPVYVTDILKRVVVSRETMDDMSLFYNYDIKDGERPEHVSDRFYNRTDYHWVILLINNITDPFYGWPLSSMQFEKYIAKKYPGFVMLIEPSDIQNFIGIAPGDTIQQGSVTAQVISWDPTFGQIYFEYTCGSAFQNTTHTSPKVISWGSNTGSYYRLTLAHLAPHHYNDVYGNNINPMIPDLSVQEVYLGLGTGNTDANTLVVVGATEANTNVTVGDSLIINAGLSQGVTGEYTIQSSTTNTTSTLITIDPAFSANFSGKTIVQYAPGEFDNQYLQFRHTPDTGFGGYVTNYDYEREKNEQKRRIRILKSELVDQFVEEFTTTLNSIV